MAWIESHQELGGHFKLKRAARLLRISKPQLAGHLHYLWWWALTYAQDGCLAGFSMEDIADAALWTKDAGQFVDALLVCGEGIGSGRGFIERDAQGGLRLHDWEEYAGRLVQRRKQAIDRTRRWREQQAGVTNANVTHNETITYASTVPNLTVPNHTVPNNEETRPAEATPTTPTDAPDADAPAPQGKLKKAKSERTDKPKGANLAPLFEAFDAAGLERPIIETVREKAAAQFLVKFHQGNISDIPECMDDIASGRYGREYERLKLSLALLANDNFFRNWLRWRDEGKPSQQRGNGNGATGGRTNPGAAGGRNREQPGADGARAAGGGGGLPERWDWEGPDRSPVRDLSGGGLAPAGATHRPS